MTVNNKTNQMKTISFKANREEMRLITAIVTRAHEMGLVKLNGYDHMTCDMDLTACHANGNPLRLADLLAADDFNFSHDICGIARHIDRETGELKNCFSPRFSAPLPVS
jgi:hypothetical protein